MDKHVRLLTLCCLFLIVVSLMSPAYAEVKSLKTDKPLYKKNIDKTIIFSGTAEEEDINEIVTITIYDYKGNFVKPAHSGLIGSEKTFEIKIPEKDLTQFSSHGIYNATAFVVQKTEGVSITFDFSLDGSPVIHPDVVSETQTSETSKTTKPISDASDEESDTVVNDVSSDSEGKSIQEKIKERIEAAKKQMELKTNPPVQVENLTAPIIENITTNEVLKLDNDSSGKDTAPEKQVEEIDLDSNLLYIIAGVGAAGAAGATVYVIRNTNRHKPDYSSYFTQPEKTESVQKSTMPPENDYALMIIKNRLAKGEITIDEFNDLKKALNEP